MGTSGSARRVAAALVLSFLAVGVACGSEGVAEGPAAEGMDQLPDPADVSESSEPGDLGQLQQGLAACPAGQVLVNGRCVRKDGQSCTRNADCQSRVCSSWFVDADGDGFGASSVPPVKTCGTTPPSGAKFATKGGDCCDSSADAFPGQTQQFGDVLPPECVLNASADHDYNCNGRNDGLPVVNCNLRSTANCATQTVVPVPQIDVPEGTADGAILCGQSVGPGNCAFFADFNPSPFGCVGCCPTNIGFTQLRCN